jgi:hypothetical protein
MNRNLAVGLLLLLLIVSRGCGGGGSGAANPDTTPPTVVSTSPADKAAGVSVAGAITVTFSEDMNGGTVTPSTFLLEDGSGSPVDGTVVCAGPTATFTPSDNLAYATSYAATVTTGVTDLAGNPMADDHNWSFTTSPVIWTRQFGSELRDAGYGVAVDGSGNIYVAGETSGSLEGNENAGGTDLFLVKYDTAGNRIWTRQFGSADPNVTGIEVSGDVAVDESGNAYVTGHVSGTLDGSTYSMFPDAFLVKFAP